MQKNTGPFLGPNDEFVSRNPLSNPIQEATVCSAEWLNAILFETVDLVESAGLTLDPLSYTQMQEAVRLLADEQAGAIQTLTAPSALGVGDGFIVGDVFAVSTEVVSVSNPVKGRRFGRIVTNKPTAVTFAQGQKVFFNPTSKTISVNETSGYFWVGDAWAASVPSAGSFELRLQGMAILVP